MPCALTEADRIDGSVFGFIAYDLRRTGADVVSAPLSSTACLVLIVSASGRSRASNESIVSATHRVATDSGNLDLQFHASAATHFGIAIWSDPAKLHLRGRNVVPAGHAGAVITFDLPAGESTQTIRCGSCSTTFVYSN